VLETTRGRGGGLRLLQPPGEIRVGDVVRRSETDFRLVECFDASTDTCSLTPSCRLKAVFGTALRAYFEVLDNVTLADIAAPAPVAPGARAAARSINTTQPMSAPISRRRPAAPPAPRPR
jgi:Rrf2 family nitric oxide-sensitive transcriptional repressor